MSVNNSKYIHETLICKVFRTKNLRVRKKNIRIIFHISLHLSKFKLKFIEALMHKTQRATIILVNVNGIFSCLRTHFIMLLLYCLKNVKF